MNSKIFLTCDEAISICNKNQYGYASLWDKIRLTIHSLSCNHCKTYSKQNVILTKIFGKHLKACDGSKNLTENEKKELDNNLSEHLKP